MTYRVLVADDSLTIQKVISITLANQPVEIVECLSEEELVSRVHEEDFDLVLLDFNLADEQSGYELASMIKQHMSKSKVLAMLGTFDSIDDSELDGSGIDDAVVKPFDSTTFIQKCMNLLNETSSDDESEDSEVDLDKLSAKFNSIEEIDSPAEVREEDELDSWIVDSPEIDEPEVDLPEVTKTIHAKTQATNLLEQEIEGWGMEVPGVISDESQTEEASLDGMMMPPVISEKEIDEGVLSAFDALESGSEEVKSDDIAMPDTDDLEYPLEADESDLLSKLTPISELNSEEVDTKKEEVSDSPINLFDEIDNIDENDFWAADETAEPEEPMYDDTKEINLKAILGEEESLEAIEDIDSIDIDQIDKEIDEETNLGLAGSDLDKMTEQIVEQIVEDLRPTIRESVEKICKEQIEAYCKEHAERVAWEIIPDLAENLIKKEIKSIRDELS